MRSSDAILSRSVSASRSFFLRWVVNLGLGHGGSGGEGCSHRAAGEDLVEQLGFGLAPERLVRGLD
ncbi:hypothetical protein ABZT51_45620 [Streptomyces sp. NPDC005373]|uniref:hypothetical protein n=1 Tax=Streptomyces sp. NPDC005373 TaxID=3156879 RepID=UPI0033ABD77A